MRPRFFADNGAGKTMFATMGFIAEDRDGGTATGRNATQWAAIRGIVEDPPCRRRLRRTLACSRQSCAVRSRVLMRRSQDRRFGTTAEHGVRNTWFGEASLQGTNGRQTWVGGVAFQQDRSRVHELPQFDYRFSSPSLFMQDEIAFTDKWTLAVSARADAHSDTESSLRRGYQSLRVLLPAGRFA